MEIEIWGRKNIFEYGYKRALKQLGEKINENKTFNPEEVQQTGLQSGSWIGSKNHQAIMNARVRGGKLAYTGKGWK